MKILNLILIALIALSQYQVGATATQCDEDAAIISVSTTSSLVATGDAMNTWDKIVACLAGLDTTKKKTSITITIDSDISTDVNNPISLSNAAIDGNTTIKFIIPNATTSGLTSGDLKAHLYDVIDTTYTNDSGSEKQVKFNIDSTLELTPSEFGIIVKHQDKMDSASTFEIKQDAKCAISDFSTCLAAQTVNETDVGSCAESLYYYPEITLTSTKKGEMKLCLEKLNTGKAIVSNLTINLSGSAAAPVAEDINLDSILTDIKGGITDLSINLSNTKTTAVAVVFAVKNLTIDYSNNGLDDTESKAVLAGLVTAAALATDSFEITFSKKDQTSANVLYDAGELLKILNLSADKKVNAFDGTDDCTIISNSDINSNGCAFVVVTPQTPDAILEQCSGVKMSFSTDLDSTLTGSKLNWSVDPAIAAWNDDLSETAELTDLAIDTAGKEQHTMSLSGYVSKGEKAIPVIFEDLTFTIGDCKPSTTFLVGGEAIAKSYPTCASAIADFTFGVVQDLTNKQNNEELKDGTTTYSWNLQLKPDTGAQTDVDVDGKKDEATFTVKGSELTQGKTYVLSLEIGAPEVIVDDYTFTIDDCDQKPVIHVNGAAVTTDAVSACQDLVISIAENDKVTLDATTTYAWSLMKDTTDVLADGSIKKDTASITVPKASLADGSYTATVDITKPTLAQATASVTIDTSITCENGGDDDKKDDDDGDDDDSSSLLSVTLALVLALALLF